MQKHCTKAKLRLMLKTKSLIKYKVNNFSIDTVKKISKNNRYFTNNIIIIIPVNKLRFMVQ